MLHTTYKNGKEKVECRRFDSIADLVELVRQVPEERYRNFDNTQNRSFTGRSFRDWEAVFTATREAWSEGIAVLDRMLNDIAGADLPKPVSRKRKMRFDEADGDELDYDRLRSGQDCWRQTRRQSTRGPATITVLVDVCANAHVDHQDILWRGAAAVALTKLLEEAGYRVELWAVEKTAGLWASPGSSSFDLDGMMAVCLKQPSDALDTSTLISAVSGWFFRTVFFRADCTGSYSVSSCLGGHAEPKPRDLDEITTDATRVLVAGAFSYEDAVAKVRQVLASLNSK